MFREEINLNGGEAGVDDVKQKKEMVSRIAVREWIDKINAGEVDNKDKLSDCAILSNALRDSSFNGISDLLPEQIQRVKSEYKKLASADFLTEKDWEMLTVFELFDVETFEHCIGTYELARQKIEKSDQIRDYLAEEGAELDCFYRACLFHDIGKIRIPGFVLHNPVREEVWAEKIIGAVQESNDNIIKKNILEYGDEELLDGLKDAADGDDAIGILKEYGLRSVSVVPIGEGLTEDQREQLERLGFSPSSPLLEIIKRHEKMSCTILRREGLYEEAEIAGNHHGYKYDHKKPEDKFRAVSHLSIADKIASLIHLADVQQAIKAKRSYSCARSTVKALSILIDDVKNGSIDDSITRIWVEDEFDNINNLSDEEKMEMGKRSDFVKIKTYLNEAR